MLQNDEGHVLLIIELRDVISVNYLHRYIGSTPLPFTDDEFIKFLSSMAHYFNISQVLIHDEHESYKTIASQLLSKTKNVINDSNPDNHAISLYSGDFKYYNLNLIGHIENKSKKYHDIPGTSHNLKNHHFKRFKSTLAKDVFEYVEKSELYNILLKTKKEFTLLDFYMHIHNNYFYLISELNNLITIYDKDIFSNIENSPWTNSYTLLNSEQYLFEKKIIPTIKTFKSNIFQDYLAKLGEEHKSITFNKYRLGLL